MLILNNQPIVNVTSHKHLGLVLSNNWTWHNHIELITSKAWSRINIMRKLKFQFDRKSLEIIYFTFMWPILEYADVVWDNCTQFNQTELEKVQLKAGRIVSGTTKLVPLASLYNELGCEELSSRWRKYKLVLCFTKWLTDFHQIIWHSYFLVKSVKLLHTV